MRVGVISEGPADFAVVRSITKAVLGLDAADIDSIRPELQTDETDARTFSNWEIVKQECIEGTVIRAYLSSVLADERLVVVQIDTAECDLPAYGVTRPDRGSGTYVLDCACAVATAVRGWTGDALAERVVEAVAVEETDAWLIPLYDSGRKNRDSGTIPRPKEHLQRVLAKTLSEKDRLRMLRDRSTYRRYLELSKPLQKVNGVLSAMKHNASLERFVRGLAAAAERIEPGSCRIPLPTTAP